jgi:cobalamin-dependent methionine synthase I
MSALLTTTMTYMKTVIDGFHAAGREQIKFAVGGAPISQMFADEIGADGYGQNASAAVDLFLKLTGAREEAAQPARGEAAPAPSSSPAAAPSSDGDGATGRKGTRSTYRVLCWQEIPSQVKAEDDAGHEVSIELSPRFAERIDAIAQKRGYTNSDDYLAQWKWSDEQERNGSADEVAAAVKAELEAKANW